MKMIVITGCSSGFGKQAAESLAREGHRVYATMRDINGRNAEKAAAMRALAESEGIDLRPLELDVCSDDSVNQAAAVVHAESGAADVVINNAGQMYVGITECFSAEELSRQLDVNIVGVHRVNRAFLPNMRERERGLVITVSSIAGRLSMPFFGVYHASKWAIEGYTQALRQELASSGVDMVLIEPGPFTTALFETSPQPEDSEERTAGYNPDVPATLEGMKTGFGEMFADDGVPTDPKIVVDRMIELIGMQPGQRPLRSVCGVDFGTRELNKVCEPMYAGTIAGLGLDEFVALKGIAGS